MVRIVGNQISPPLRFSAYTTTTDFAYTGAQINRKIGSREVYRWNQWKRNGTQMFSYWCASWIWYCDWCSCSIYVVLVLMSSGEHYVPKVMFGQKLSIVVVILYHKE